jgi:hypothetical protein
MGIMIPLNNSGHLSVSWTDNQDPKLLEMIQKKIEEGYSFFIEEDDVEVLIKSATDIGERRRVILHDDDLEKLFASGVIELLPAPEQVDISKPMSKSTDPKRIARSKSVVTRGKGGG